MSEGKKGKKDKGKGGDGGAARGSAASYDSVFDLPDVPCGLPPEVELARTRVICGPDFNSNVRARQAAAACGAPQTLRPPDAPRCAQTEDYSSANAFMVCGVDNAFTLDKFKDEFSIDVTSIGAHPPRNSRRTCCALRRGPACCARALRAGGAMQRLARLEG